MHLKQLTVRSVRCFPGRFSYCPSDGQRGRVSGNKELRHFKISNKNPSATLRSRWWACKGGGEGSRCSTWGQGAASGKAKRTQKHQEIGNPAGEGRFPPARSPGLGAKDPPSPPPPTLVTCTLSWVVSDIGLGLG